LTKVATHTKPNLMEDMVFSHIPSKCVGKIQDIWRKMMEIYGEGFFLSRKMMETYGEGFFLVQGGDTRFFTSLVVGWRQEDIWTTMMLNA